MKPPSFIASQLQAQNGRAKSIAAVIAILCATILSACTPQPFTAVLFDFETDSDLDRFGWKCRSRFEISSDFSHSGRSSLRFEFHPAKQVGFSTGAVPSDWSQYKSLDFWVYNPSGIAVPLNLQINRREPSGKFKHLIAKVFEIAPGPNKLSIPLKAGYASQRHPSRMPPLTKGERGILKSTFSEAGEESKGIESNLNKVDGFFIFMQDIPSVTVLYFDAFKLQGTAG